MYRYDDLIAKIASDGGEQQVLLKTILPIGRIDKIGKADVFLSVDGVDYVPVENDACGRCARYLKVCSMAPCEVRFFTGRGFYAIEETEFTDRFIHFSDWAGSDGINSFNLSTGKDVYGSAKDAVTMFVFGDTLMGPVDRKTNRRIEPVHMPTNTYGIMRGMPSRNNAIDFYWAKDADGVPLASLSPDKSFGEGMWYWLQDGVVIGQKLYLMPMLMGSDESKPEGFQFKVHGVNLVEIDIVNDRPDFVHCRQQKTSLHHNDGVLQWIVGIAFMPFDKASGYENADGYIYVYGYINGKDCDNRCKMIVARTTRERIADTDTWEFFDGNGFTKELLQSKPVLDHISCEMSVMPIESGTHKGKFLAVFQYDVSSSYTAYAIGETPYGPFGEVQKVYFCDENLRIDPTCYMYNAKAHPHISEPDGVLVSYNVNTPSLKANYENADIYRPRFFRLHDTTYEKEIQR